YMLVTIGAGCKGEDIDLKTSLYGYQVPMTIFPVGSAIFGNGGFGFLSRRYGLATDNVVEVEIVTAKGEILYLREDDESDEMKELWWAFRGAASTLGVATRYRVKAYPLRTCYSGDIVYPFNPLTTPSLITHWRDCLKGIKRELYSNITLTAGATPNQHVVVMQICWTGEREEGEKIVQSLTSWTGERSLFSNVSERYWLDQQDSVKRLLQPKSDHRWFIRADLVESL
ncbi:FAD-binding domain-containing protein, partial [Atractiella rhizophila]